MIVKAYAKINLALNIVGTESNGYHLMDAVMIPLKLHDTIEIKKLPETALTYVTADTFTVEQEKEDIVKKAIELLRKKYKFKQNLNVHIYKRIPIGGGMGGGSADVAAVLKGLVKMLKLDATEEDLAEIGKKIGCDIPFCIYNKPARCTHLGEIVEPIENNSQYYVLIITPKKPNHTKDIYKALEDKDIKNSNIDDLLLSLKNNDEVLLSKSLGNSLLKPALRLNPEIQEILDLVKDNGFNLSGMTGSGSCVYVLTKNKKILQKFALKTISEKYQFEFTKTL